jgi:DNA-binding CsgD family transcriptional regulator
MMMAWRVQQVESPVEQPIMLRVIDPGLPARLDESALRELFLLTRAEARLACQLASGATLEQAAKAARVSVNTVRTHLARVFGKTGTCRQSQLVTLVLLTAAQHRLEAPALSSPASAGL